MQSVIGILVIGEFILYSFNLVKPIGKVFIVINSYFLKQRQIGTVSLTSLRFTPFCIFWV
jgi:hypothetical protein